MGTEAPAKPCPDGASHETGRFPVYPRPLRCPDQSLPKGCRSAGSLPRRASNLHVQEKPSRDMDMPLQRLAISPSSRPMANKASQDDGHPMYRHQCRFPLAYAMATPAFPGDRPAFRRETAAFLQDVWSPKPAPQRRIDCLLLRNELNGTAGSSKWPMSILVYGTTTRSSFSL